MLFDKEKSFTNPLFCIQELSNKLNISPKQFSQAIKQNRDQNFYDFINSFRINDVNNLLLDKDLRINEIIDRVGYKNRSTFKMIFKYQCNVTLSEFRKNLKIQ